MAFKNAVDSLESLEIPNRIIYVVFLNLVQSLFISSSFELKEMLLVSSIEPPLLSHWSFDFVFNLFEFGFELLFRYLAVLSFY